MEYVIRVPLKCHNFFRKFLSLVSFRVPSGNQYNRNTSTKLLFFSLNSLSLSQCKWCGRLRLCSDGLDRNRQDWLSFGCDHHNVENSVECSAARERDEQFRRVSTHKTRGR